MKGDHLEDLGGDVSASQIGGMDRFDFAQDRDTCRALVTAVMILQAPYNTENFLNSSRAVNFSVPWSYIR